MSAMMSAIQSTSIYVCNRDYSMVFRFFIGIALISSLMASLIEISRSSAYSLRV